MFPLLYLAPYRREDMKALKDNIERLEKLVERNQLEEVFDELKPLVKYTEYRITSSLLLSDFNEIQQEALNGSITGEEERVRLVQIKRSLLQLLNHIRNTQEGMVEEGEEEIVQITLTKNEKEFQALLEQKLSKQYTNLEKISSGDTAIIYKADKIDNVTQLPQRVAIKVIKPLSVIDDENLENIREDLTKAKQLSGLDGIISIIDVGLDAPPRYIVTEYIDGMRLSERLAKGWPYQLKEIREMLYTMGRALLQGHQDGLVHNNLWPSNILVDKKKGPRISPFQVIKASYYKRSFERIRLFSMYWSPEQVNSDRATQLSDQYSFGLIAFELFKGQPFFRGGSILEILRRRLDFDENPKLLGQELKDTLCPPAFARAIKRMLNYRPEDRFPDMEDVLEEINKIPAGSQPAEKHPEDALLRQLRNCYKRCSRKDEFYTAFYSYFLEKAPHTREIFDRAWTARMAKSNRPEDKIWKHQHRMLDLAVERMLQYPSVSTQMSKRLQSLAKQHTAVGVQPEDYATFMECLRDTIWEFDKENWKNFEELERAWKVATENSMRVMRGGVARSS